MAPAPIVFGDDLAMALGGTPTSTGAGAGRCTTCSSSGSPITAERPATPRAS